MSGPSLLSEAEWQAALRLEGSRVLMLRKKYRKARLRWRGVDEDGNPFASQNTIRFALDEVNRLAEELREELKARQP